MAKHDYLQKRPKNGCKEMEKSLPGSYGSYIHNKLTKWKCIDQNQIFIYLIYFLFPLKLITFNEVKKLGIKIKKERLEKTEPGKEEMNRVMG